jgi:peptidoglycan glycosyltransferase
MMEPRLLMRVTGPNGQPRLLSGPKVYRRALSSERAAALRADMIRAVQAGTGGGARMDGLRVGGKTGSAEAVDDKAIQPHAWFVGFIDDAAHPLAIAVIVEKSGSGGQVAAPLAKKFISKAISLGL